MISVIIPWRDRPEILQTLPRLLEFANTARGEVILVNLDANCSELGDIIVERSPRLRCLNVTGEKFFSKPLASNVGASHASHPILFFTDCDILYDVPELGKLFDEFQFLDDAFITWHRVTETVPSSTRHGGGIVEFGYVLTVRLQNGRELRIEDSEENRIDGSRCAPGLLMVRKTHFEEIQGYNSHLTGWGWEDQDMIARLTLALGLRRHQRGHATHISHDVASRTKYYEEKDQWTSRDRAFRMSLRNYNDGLFLGTLESDVLRTSNRCERVFSD